MLTAMVERLRDTIIVIVLAILTKATAAFGKPPSRAVVPLEGAAYCLSWRLGVEANNVRGWRTVPLECLHHVETYMTGGQYDRDLDLIVKQMLGYANSIVLSGDGMDAWILDVDDTCISNVFYYKGRRYGCDPFDASGFKAWASLGECPAIREVLGLYKKLIEMGFKVILLTGRDEEILGQCTINNLHAQGFTGYERLIMRSATYRGKSAIAYKSDIRRQLVEEGYKIWGNVGDQWSDLQGEYVGDRTFKIPNPMYFVP